MQRLQIDDRRRCFAPAMPEDPGRAFKKLALPLRDLVGVNIELLRLFGQRLFALQGGQGHLRLECRRVVPTRSFGHNLS